MSVPWPLEPTEVTWGGWEGFWAAPRAALPTSTHSSEAVDPTLTWQADTTPVHPGKRREGWQEDVVFFS